MGQVATRHRSSGRQRRACGRPPTPRVWTRLPYASRSVSWSFRMTWWWRPEIAPGGRPMSHPLGLSERTAAPRIRATHADVVSPAPWARTSTSAARTAGTLTVRRRLVERLTGMGSGYHEVQPYRPIPPPPPAGPNLGENLDPVYIDIQRLRDLRNYTTLAAPHDCTHGIGIANMSDDNNPYLASERAKLRRKLQRDNARALAHFELQDAMYASEAAAFGRTPEEHAAHMRKVQERRDKEREGDEQAQRDFAGRFMPKGARLPDAQAVANALTEAHAGGPPVGLAVMLVEAGSSPDIESALTQTRELHGRAVADCLRDLHWEQTRRSRGILWKPPDLR